MENKENENGIGLRIFLITLIVLMLAVVIALIVWIVTRFDKNKIGKNDLSAAASSVTDTAETPTVVKTALKPEDIDTQIIKQNFSYVSITSDTLYKGVVAVGEQTAGYVPDSLKLVYNALFSADGLQIASEESAKFKCAKEALQPLNDMLNALYSETGSRSIMINSAYEQNEENTSYTDSLTDLGETSCGEHENGLSFDFGIYDSESDSFSELDGTDEYKWLCDNAYKYGFILRYPEGREEATGYEFNASHFRYVGEAAAKIMHENDLCLEEYIDYMRTYSYDSPLIIEVNDVCVMCWYTADSGLNAASIQIPSIGGTDAEYTVSGNGSDGCIITAILTEDYAYSTDTSTDSVQDSN